MGGFVGSDRPKFPGLLGSAGPEESHYRLIGSFVMRAFKIVEDLPPPEDELTALVSAALAGSSTRVEDAQTLPPKAYMSQAFFDLEVEKIFKKEWICVGHVAQIPNV